MFVRVFALFSFVATVIYASIIHIKIEGGKNGVDEKPGMKPNYIYINIRQHKTHKASSKMCFFKNNKTQGGKNVGRK